MSTNDSAGLPPAGWYPDPRGPGQRWWDGTAWTDQYDPRPPAAAPSGESAYQGAPGYGASSASGSASYAHAAGYVPIGAWRSAIDDRPPVTGMGSAIRVVLSKYAQFFGRAGRGEFWFWWLFEVLASICLVIALVALNVGFVVMGSGIAYAGLILVGIVTVLWWLGTIVPTLAVTVRRLRDGGFHWALIFLQVVPGGGLVVLILCLLPSKYA